MPENRAHLKELAETVLIEPTATEAHTAQSTIAGKDTEYERELEYNVRKVIGERGADAGKVEAFIG